MCYISRVKQSKRKKKKAARAKPRKPKFLSLKEHLAVAVAVAPPQTQTQTQPRQKQKPKPEESPSMAMQQDLNPDSDSPVACLLGQDAEPDGGPTITDIFGSSISSNSSSVALDEVLSPASPSVNWDGLARRALRGRERWVFCRSKSKSTSTIGSNSSSSASAAGVDLWGVGCMHQRQQQPQPLLLKLDYQEVLTAWSDRGSLYIDGEAPQVVPDLYHPYEDDEVDDDDSITPNVVVEVGNGGALRVPEMEEQSGKECDRISREARVMRYKEKRQSRLFAKRIRYEVRKRNAEKRPRIKGRFVKRVDAM